MSAFSSRELKVGAVAMVIGAAAIAWMVTHPKRSSRLASVPAPQLSAFTAHRGEASRPLAVPGEVQIDEVVDFQIEVKERSYVYVLRFEGGRLQLEWGQPIGQAAWEPGVYAPDWDPATRGLRFQSLGEARLYVLASIQPLVDVDTWTVPNLEDPGTRCMGCAVATARFTVKPGAGTTAPMAPDGGERLP